MARMIAPPPSPETYSALGPMSLLPGAEDVEVALTRLIPAPREAVYEALTDPAMLAQWWGPPEYTVAEAQTDPRPGGRYHLVLQAADGTQYPVWGSYIQADAPERVVMTDEAFELPQDWPELMHEYRGEEETPLRLIIRMMLAGAEGGTSLTVISRFLNVDDPAETLGTETTGLWNESLTRLESVLTERRSQRKG